MTTHEPQTVAVSSSSPPAVSPTDATVAAAPSGPPSYSRQKGSERIQINNFLGAVCIGVLSVLLGLADTRSGAWVIALIGIAIPCFLTSSLAYAKTTYRPDDEYVKWDRLGWWGHTIGYVLVLDALAVLMFRNGYVALAWLFVGVAVLSLLVYSAVDLSSHSYRLPRRLWRLAAHVGLIGLGFVLPIALGWA
jgi:hypothetical protein